MAPSRPPFPLPKLPIIRIKAGSSSHRSSRRILHSLSTLTTSSPALLHSLLSRLPPSISLFNSLLRFSSSSSIPHLPLLIFSHLRSRGVSPTPSTFHSLLLSRSSPCATLSLHSLLLKSGILPADPFVSNTLLHRYSSLHLPSSILLFEEMLPHRGHDVVSWTILIRSHSAAGRHRDALLLFRSMLHAGLQPNRVTAVCALSACSALNTLDTGAWIHHYLIERSGWGMDAVLGTALVGMYAKCRRADKAIRVFEEMKGVRNVYTWNALIGGLNGKEAVEWFGRMEEDGVRPDAVTLIAVLRACSRSGMVGAGKSLFDSIVKGRYGFGPNVKHYGCVVDLLGRAGLLEEAMELVEGMPFEPGVAVWGSLLGACRARGELGMAEIAAKKLVELEPGNVAHYMVLSDLYMEMGSCMDGDELRRVMKERGLMKDADYGFADVDELEYTQQEAFG